MLWLDSTKDRPDFGWFKQYLEQRMAEGVRVQRPLQDEADATMLYEEAARWLQQECGIDNPNSPKQVLEFIGSCGDAEAIGMCTDRFSGKLTSKADALVEVAAAGRKWAMQLIKYRTAFEVVKNINSVMTRATIDGVVHPIIDFQKTNRVSYKEPALMNINKDILWKMVKPFKEGNYIYSVDIKNQEPWILAHMLKATELIALVKEAGDQGYSFYKAVYKAVMGTEVESEAAYGEVKMAWNMLSYGGTYDGLAARCKVIDARKMYDFFKGFKELKEYTGRTYGRARKGIQSAETVFGTTVYADKTGGGLQRSLMDIPIQGTGADILCMLVKHIVEQLKEYELDNVINIYYTRHDEIIFEVDKKFNDSVGDQAVIDQLRELCRHRVDDWVEFGLDVEKVA